MPVSSITNHKEIQFHHGFSHAHVTHKNAIVMPALNPTSYASKDFRTKPSHLTHIDPNLTVQFIEFIYGNDKFSHEAINIKTEKYQSLIEDIKALGWNVDPLIVIVARARATTFKPSMTSLKATLTSPFHKSRKYSWPSTPLPSNMQ